MLKFRVMVFSHAAAHRWREHNVSAEGERERKVNPSESKARTTRRAASLLPNKVWNAETPQPCDVKKQSDLEGARGVVVMVVVVVRGRGGDEDEDGEGWTALGLSLSLCLCLILSSYST